MTTIKSTDNVTLTDQDCKLKFGLEKNNSFIKINKIVVVSLLGKEYNEIYDVLGSFNLQFVSNDTKGRTMSEQLSLGAQFSPYHKEAEFLFDNLFLPERNKRNLVPTSTRFTDLTIQMIPTREGRGLPSVRLQIFFEKTPGVTRL